MQQSLCLVAIACLICMLGGRQMLNTGICMVHSSTQRLQNKTFPSNCLFSVHQVPHVKIKLLRATATTVVEKKKALVVVTNAAINMAATFIMLCQETPGKQSSPGKDWHDKTLVCVALFHHSKMTTVEKRREERGREGGERESQFELALRPPMLFNRGLVSQKKEYPKALLG